MASAKQIKLWELAGEDPHISISPFVWRVRLLLAYKGQSYESIPWRFADKDVIKPFEKVHARPMHRSSSVHNIRNKPGLCLCYVCTVFTIWCFALGAWRPSAYVAQLDACPLAHAMTSCATPL